MTQESLILSSTDEFGVGTLILNRPEKLNTFHQVMLDQWSKLLNGLLADQSVKVIVVRGNGKAFCAGGDIGNMLERMNDDSLERKNYIWEHVHPIALALDRAEKPIIAAVHGAARGAGCDMALLCDLRIAAESASFAESYINSGLIAGDAGTYTLPRIIGTARALELFWTGRAVGAQEALQLGMVNRVVPDDQLLPATYALAHQIAKQPQQAVRFYRRAVYQGLRMDLAAHLDMVSSHMSILRDTPDHKAKVNEFLATRKSRKS